MPSRGLTNNSDLGGKWTATPSPVSLGTDEMMLLDYLPAVGHSGSTSEWGASCE